MGIGLDGTVRNIIGQDAEQLIKTRIRDWLDSRQLIVQHNAEQTQFELPDGYSMRYGSEPDVEFSQVVNGEPRVVATIEVKGAKTRRAHSKGWAQYRRALRQRLRIV